MQGGAAGSDNDKRASVAKGDGAGPVELPSSISAPPLNLCAESDRLHVPPGLGISLQGNRCTPPPILSSSTHTPPLMHAEENGAKFMVSPIPASPSGWGSPIFGPKAVVNHDRVSLESSASRPRDSRLRDSKANNFRPGRFSLASALESVWDTFSATSTLMSDKGPPPSSDTTLRSRYMGRSVIGGTSVAKRTVFMDQQALKQQVIANLFKPQYHVHDMYHERGCFQRIARSALFENLALLTIGLNALWIAIDTDYNHETVLLEAHPLFQVVEHTFCALFTTEIIVRFMAFSRKVNVLWDAWFMFDAFMVALMVSETWIMTLIIFLNSSADAGWGNASLLRMLRVLRLARIARMARLLRCLPELMILLKGMYSAARSVFFTLLLLIFNIYIFAIAFTQMTDGTNVGELFFDGVLASMYTLTVRGTLLDSPHIVANALGDENYVFVFGFLLFILLTALTVMNMLIGVLCEVVSTVAAVEKEEMAVTMVKSKLHDIVHDIDENGDMEISRDEFSKIVGNKEASSQLSAVGVDVVGLIDFADFIFECGSEGATDKALSFHEFMEVVLSLRGSNQSTVKDIIDLRKYIQTMFTTANQQLHSEVTRLTHKIHTIEKTQRDFISKSEERHAKVERQLSRIESLLRKSLGKDDHEGSHSSHELDRLRSGRQGSRSPHALSRQGSRSPHALSGLRSETCGNLSLSQHLKSPRDRSAERSRCKSPRRSPTVGENPTRSGSANRFGMLDAGDAEPHDIATALEAMHSQEVLS